MYIGFVMSMLVDWSGCRLVSLFAVWGFMVVDLLLVCALASVCCLFSAVLCEVGCCRWFGVAC